MDIEWKWTDGWMDGWIKVNGIWAMNELVTILWFPEIRNYIPLCKWGTQIEYTLKHNTFCPSNGRVHFFTIATYSAGSIGRLIGYIRWSELGHILRHTRHPTWSQFVTGSLEEQVFFRSSLFVILHGMLHHFFLWPTLQKQECFLHNFLSSVATASKRPTFESPPVQRHALCCTQPSYLITTSTTRSAFLPGAFVGTIDFQKSKSWPNVLLVLLL